jgi:hypothetical protein
MSDENAKPKAPTPPPPEYEISSYVYDIRADEIVFYLLPFVFGAIGCLLFGFGCEKLAIGFLIGAMAILIISPFYSAMTRRKG